jgi:hypothetical protein
MTVVLVPLSVGQLSGLREAPLAGPVTGFAVTPSMRGTFGLGDADEEEADRTALLLAGLSSLISYGRRLAVVIDAQAVDDGDPLGEVTLRGAAWGEVSAIFADSPEAAPVVSDAAEAVSGLDLDAAWDTDVVRALMAEHDLLWYGPNEVDTLLGV